MATRGRAILTRGHKLLALLRRHGLGRGLALTCHYLSACLGRPRPDTIRYFDVGIYALLLQELERLHNDGLQLRRLLPHLESIMEQYARNDFAAANSYTDRFRQGLESIRVNNPAALSEPAGRLFAQDRLNALHRSLRRDFSPGAADRRPDVAVVLCPQWSTWSPPLGLYCVAAAIVAEGYDAEVVDLNIKYFRQAAAEEQYLWDGNRTGLWIHEDSFTAIADRVAGLIDQAVRQLGEINPRVMAFSLTATNRIFTTAVIKGLRRQGYRQPIILGGPQCDFHQPDEIIEPGLVDAIVMGEGEETIIELLAMLDNERGRRMVPGAWVFDHDHARYLACHSRPAIADLDALPLPFVLDLKMRDYAYDRLEVMANRGCVNACAFCSEHARGRKFRMRSAKSVVTELRYYRQLHGQRNFFFHDSALNCSSGFLAQLCETLLNDAADVSWGCLCMFRNEMTPAVLALMKKAGCSNIIYGLESGSDKILTAMGKKFQTQTAARVIKDTHAAGIEVGLNVIAGFPGEGEDDFVATIDFIRKHRDYLTGISSLTTCDVIRGSLLEQQPERFGIHDAHTGNRWFTDDGNNYAARKQRVTRLLAALEEDRIPAGNCNIFSHPGEELVRTAARDCAADSANRLIDRYHLDNHDEKLAAGRDRNVSLDLALVICPQWSTENPPLGLYYIYATVLKQGYTARVVDLNIRFYHQVAEEHRYLWNGNHTGLWNNDGTFPAIRDLLQSHTEQAIAQLLAQQPRAIALSVAISNWLFTRHFVQRLRARGYVNPVILGGPHCDFRPPQEIIEPGLVDAIVVGEGEETMRELVPLLLGAGPRRPVPGAWVYADGRYLDYSPRAPITALDDIPFPFSYGITDRNYTSPRLELVANRGCVNKCLFCSEHARGRGFRKRSPANVFAELRYYRQRYDQRIFFFHDTALNCDSGFLAALCQLLIARPLGIAWSCLCFIAPAMDLNLLQLMKQAGCVNIVYGVECGSDKIIKAMGKKFRAAEATRVLSDTHAAGIEVGLNIMVGFPGESENEFAETVAWLKANQPSISAIASLTTCDIIEGSLLYRQADQFKLHDYESGYNWFTDDGNDYAVRARRAEQLLELCATFGIPVHNCNLGAHPVEATACNE